MPSISEIFGVATPPAVRDNKATLLVSPDPSLLYGLELEIEGIPVNPESLYVTGMRGEQDNSLRENAHGIPWEFITKPATYSVLHAILQRFFDRASLTLEKNYSERCSVHVHANVLDFQPAQLKGLCLLYQVFERLFYAYAGSDRDKNIFCVPWAQTALTYRMIDSLTEDGIGGLRGWQKYTGLNLIPVTTQGTVEFRHLPGTPDLKRIMDWVALIGCLFAYARNTNVSLIQSRIIEVNTTSAYTGILNDVFGQWAHILNFPARDALLEEGVIDVKYMLLSIKTPQEKSKGMAHPGEHMVNIAMRTPQPIMDMYARGAAAVAGGFNGPDNNGWWQHLDEIEEQRLVPDPRPNPTVNPAPRARRA